MAKRRSSDLAVGAMFALALLILALGVMAVGGDSQLFNKSVEYRVAFPNTHGLVQGSPVEMGGVQVGTVLGIAFPSDPQQAGIEVRIGIREEQAGRVREGVHAALRLGQLLSGEKFIEIIPGKADGDVLPPGSFIEPHEDPEIMEQAAVAAENLNDITVSLKNILGALERGEGLIGQMINDPEFGRQGVEDLGLTMGNLRKLSDELGVAIESRQGVVGKLLYDEGFADQLGQVGVAAEKITELVSSLRTDQGALGALLQEDGAGQQAVEDLAGAAASLKTVASRLESSEGLIGKLINDTEYADAVAADVREITSNLAEITGKINRGEGTLGALINERTLHDGLEDVVAGVNDSKFARWMLRHYQKKGITLEPEEAEPPASR
ncbi:MAG: MCE family protein [bacterium]|nr:MCE family protein [bacterium]